MEPYFKVSSFRCVLIFCCCKALVQFITFFSPQSIPKALAHNECGTDYFVLNIVASFFLNKNRIPPLGRFRGTWPLRMRSRILPSFVSRCDHMNNFRPVRYEHKLCGNLGKLLNRKDCACHRSFLLPPVGNSYLMAGASAAILNMR